MNFENILELQRNRMGVYGSGTKDDLINTTFNDFEENPAYRVVEHNSEQVGVHYINKSGQSGHKEMIMITKPPQLFNVGDYVLDSDGINWMCYGLDMYPIRKHYVDKTNHNLKWIDSTNKLITRPCIWSSKTLYTTGVKEEELITLPDGKVGLQLPADADTDKLDKTYEFIFNKNKYKITYLNSTEFKGLLLLICEEDLPSSADDMVNEIANRYINGVDRLGETEPTPEEPNPSEGITYVIEGSDTLKVAGNQLYTTKKFIDGVQDFTAKFDWTVSDEAMGEIWESTDTTLELEGKNKNVGQYFTITATDRVSGESITKQIKMLSMY